MVKVLVKIVFRNNVNNSAASVRRSNLDSTATNLLSALSIIDGSKDLAYPFSALGAADRSDRLRCYQMISREDFSVGDPFL